jgi:hypothetical protein
VASKPNHVIVRDGSSNRGGPPPAPPVHDVQPKAAPTAPPKGLGPPYSTDHSVVGQYEVDRAGFEAIRGSNPTPRHELEPSSPQPANASDLEFLRQGLID